MFNLFRLLIFTAMALLASSSPALACPDHDAARPAVIENVSHADCASAAPAMHAVPAATPQCVMEASGPLCGGFHLCCVTPPAVPAASADTIAVPVVFGSTGAIASIEPADTGIIPQNETPPPRS